MDLKDIAKQFTKELSQIKIALFDVDGILTDGRIFYASDEVGFNRFFHTHDGYGMKILRKAGIKVGIITGGDSLGVKKRFELLGVDYMYMGKEDKRQALIDILKKEKLRPEHVLYMGDEFFDMPLLKAVGFAATVPEASFEVREICHYITKRSGGHGAAREVIDMLRIIQKIKPEIEMDINFEHDN